MGVIIIEADSKAEALKRFRKTKRLVVDNKLVKVVPTSARKTRREGIYEVNYRRRKK